MEAQGSVWKGIRHVKTCTECKQAKLRCDSRAKFPSPCSRCETRKLHCNVDPSFRRLPARQRLEALSKELQELRQQRDSDDGPLSTPSASGAPHVTGDGTEASVESGPPDHDLTLDADILSVQIGHAVLYPQTVIYAFRLFTVFFYPHFPVLGPISITKAYRNHPVLFWTIVVIVIIRLPEAFEEGTAARVEEPYRQLLQQQLLSAPLPLHKIHALSLLCMFPLPVKRQPEDPSWLYSGLAVAAGRHMGLHRRTALPSLASVGVVAGNLSTRAHAWLGCFLVDHSLAMYAGLPPLLTSPADVATVRHYLTKYPVPRTMEVSLRINLILNNFMGTLFQSESDVVDSSLVQLLDTELNGLKSSLSESWSEIDEISILSTQLHVYVMVITKPHTSSQTRAILLKLGLAAALRTIHLTIQFVHSKPTSPHDEQAKPFDLTPIQRYRALPKNSYRGPCYAIIFLLRFFILSKQALPEETEIASKHVTLLQNLFQTASQAEDDEYGRVAAVFEALSNAPPLTGDMTRVPRELSDRMGVSIVLDSIRMASEVRGRVSVISEEEPALEAGSQPPSEAGMSFMDDINLNDPLLGAGDHLWFADVDNPNVYGGMWTGMTWNMFTQDFDMGGPSM